MKTIHYVIRFQKKLKVVMHRKHLLEEFYKMVSFIQISLNSVQIIRSLKKCYQKLKRRHLKKEKEKIANNV